LPDQRAAVKLTFLAGVGDVLTFPRFRLYVTRVSGTLYNSATAIVDQRWAEAWFLSSLLLGYAVGAALFQLLRKKWVPYLMLALFALADLLWRVALPARIAAVPIAVAFGVVNTLSVDSNKTVTNVFSGHMQKFGSGIAKRDQAAIRLSGKIVLSFLAGVAVAALAVKYLPRKFPAFTILGCGYFAVLADFLAEKRAEGTAKVSAAQPAVKNA
jgi:uncharacterized membrane protein YoaK (UPF0700 family)